jgi:hypothetical protein
MARQDTQLTANLNVNGQPPPPGQDYVLVKGTHAGVVMGIGLDLDGDRFVRAVMADGSNQMFYPTTPDVVVILQGGFHATILKYLAITPGGER